LVSTRVEIEKREDIASEMSLNQAIQLENEFAANSSLTITVSEEERQKLKSRVPGSDIQTLWMSYPSKSVWQEKALIKNTALFVGNFRHMPNKVSLDWFIEEILPKVLEKCDNFVLNVVGTGLSPIEISKLARKGVNFLGFVDNLEPIYEESTIVVIPLKYGAGIKGKMCEALGMSSCVVSTSFGAEGLGLKPDKEFLLANDSSEFANQIIRLLTNQQLRNELSKSACEFAHTSLSPLAFQEKIAKIAKIFG
jgi:glycosyltransferase involved in cell wall biosynthesis